MKMFLQTFSGIISLIAGVSLLFFFFSGLSIGFNLLLLVSSLLLIVVGTFLFIRVSKIANSITENTKAVEVVPIDSGSKLLEKNNQLVKDWSHVTDKKDNLKAVQIAVSAEASAVAEEGK